MLLILTDGLVNDMESTIASLVTASNHPLSVLIVGVGSENFSGEQRLTSIYLFCDVCEHFVSNLFIAFALNIFKYHVLYYFILFVFRHESVGW